MPPVVGQVWGLQSLEQPCEYLLQPCAGADLGDEPPEPFMPSVSTHFALQEEAVYSTQAGAASHGALAGLRGLRARVCAR